MGKLVSLRIFGAVGLSIDLCESSSPSKYSHHYSMLLIFVI